jgi:hypothetical protein
MNIIKFYREEAQRHSTKSQDIAPFTRQFTRKFNMTQVSIGSYAREMIAANPQATNQELLDMVLAKFQQANTSLACIAWYKSNMKKNGYNKKVQERTLDVIKANIAEVEMSLELLKEELELKILEEREHVEAQFKYYADLKAQLDAQNDTNDTPEEPVGAGNDISNVQGG